ncbi:pirin family protein [Oleiagrimonas citrea]|uniref:Pirin family protein n=1 Tax=Oleiagrimonas citrea TaxID=1665687 RepID=A0A846ZNW3_9GAMM|nr:pirin family protein [Oleiagrimonas citrea]NKZ39250.1 pirin family protein [Oleiagrimonas citrea]
MSNDVFTRIEPKTHDLGDGFMVRRVLPHAQACSVGPFVFFDHMGPVDLPPGKGMDVRPHPHIGLATVTWLFDGCIRHRDSLGSDQEIHPGEVNWMTAGRGIVHSERTPDWKRDEGGRMHGIQTWVALPKADETVAPDFHHYATDQFPALELPGARLRLMAGSGWGAQSPVKVFAPTFFAEAHLQTGAELELPPEHEEHGVYVVEGELRFGEQRLDAFDMGVHRGPDAPKLQAVTPSTVILVGGAPLDGPRFVWWNFVASERSRIDQAGRDWKDGRFDTVPGDDEEFIPLPEK